MPSSPQPSLNIGRCRGTREPEFIEFIKELPKDSTSQKAKTKADKSAKPKAAAVAADVVGKVADKLKDATV